jgi:site-specific recombinase XerD
MENLNIIEKSQEFIKSLERNGKSFNTVKNYRTDINTFTKFLSSKKHKPLINEITHSMLKEYGNFLEKAYPSPNSRRRRVQALRLFFDWLVANKLYPDNPVKKLISSPKVVDIPRPVPFNEVLKLHQYLLNEASLKEGLDKLLATRNLLVFHFIYGAGLTVSDIETLTTESVLEGDNMRVMVLHPKRDPYSILLPEDFKSLYLNYFTKLKLQKEKDQIEFDKLLFNANPYRILKGGLSARGIEIIFKDLSKKLDIEITAKKLRQSCIFNWLLNDVKPSQVKEWMGVQPQYSLAPYTKLIEEEPAKYVFQNIPCIKPSESENTEEDQA